MNDHIAESYEQRWPNSSGEKEIRSMMHATDHLPYWNDHSSETDAGNLMGQLREVSAKLRSSAGQVPQGFTPEQADCILKCREALLSNDEAEAWHWLYQLQTKQPHYDPFAPWINLEIAQDKLAAAERSAK